MGSIVVDKHFLEQTIFFDIGEVNRTVAQKLVYFVNHRSFIFIV